MNYLSYFRYLLFLLAINSSSAYAGVYIALSPSQFKIDTPDAATRPLVTDFRLGYAISGHQFELAIMRSINEDTLNQLRVDVPAAASVFYRYSPYQRDQLKVHLIVGASQIDVESSYPGVPETTDRFESGSFGIGLEEDFSSIQGLKLKLDLIRLYHGDDLNINGLSLGIRYEF